MLNQLLDQIGLRAGLREGLPDPLSPSLNPALPPQPPTHPPILLSSSRARGWTAKTGAARTQTWRLTRSWRRSWSSSSAASCPAGSDGPQHACHG